MADLPSLSTLQIFPQSQFSGANVLNTTTTNNNTNHQPHVNSNFHSPWSGSESRYHEDLTLPPIHIERDQGPNFPLPPISNNPQFFANGSLSPNTVNQLPFDSHIHQPERQVEAYRQPYTSFLQTPFSSSPNALGGFIDINDLEELQSMANSAFGPFDDDIQPRLESPPRNMPAQTRILAGRESFIDLTDSPARPVAPTARKRGPDDQGEVRATKALKVARPDSRGSPTGNGMKVEDVEVVDLRGIEGDDEYKEHAAKQAADLMKKQAQDEAARPVKLAQFNCIICMDQPTDLTITHCGHMFCSECLHQALYAGDKKTCPVCRTIISTQQNGRTKTRSKTGFFALSMKLSSAKKQGKKPALT
ncbi:hypothetical protein BJ875DRAFT_482132 [Amylocarpus encephaloides]|uniref:RING-type domain-containing protein n=1 Tax=Amylocarpus encephaloides TaxID=45428 RepID=A0A9P7YN16_9HELO|nr:hypothetical protein BJ875DRAFT_482132 [Amylocarpus encephaloides]